MTPEEMDSADRIRASHDEPTLETHLREQRDEAVATIGRIERLIHDYDTEGGGVPVSALVRALDGNVTP